VFLSPPHLSRETEDQLGWKYIGAAMDVRFDYIPENVVPLEGSEKILAIPSAEMTIRFELDEGVFDGFFRVFSDDHLKRAYELEPLPVSNRWNRVYQRWGFKHRNKCCRCNATEGLVRVTLGQLLFCVDAEACDERAKLTHGNA
jgi:hypothetical protein